MGSHIEFFSFRRAPSVPSLDSCDWLTGYRLFEGTTPRGWFLEGPSEEDGITFFETIGTRGKVDELAPVADEWVQKAKSATAGSRGQYVPFRKRDVALPLLMSAALDEPVFYAFGDDDEADCAFVCKGGALLRARMQVSADEALVMEPDGVRRETLGPPDTPRFLHQIVSEELQGFLSLDDLWLVSSDPFEIDRSTYRQIAGKGAPAPLPQRFNAVAELERRELDTETFGAYVQIVDRWLRQCYAPAFIDAPRPQRDVVEGALSDCSRFAHARFAYLKGGYRQASFAAIHAHLQQAMTYIFLLRPKPEFRKSSVDFRKTSRELHRGWWFLRTKLRINLA